MIILNVSTGILFGGSGEKMFFCIVVLLDCEHDEVTNIIQEKVFLELSGFPLDVTFLSHFMKKYLWYLLLLVLLSILFEIVHN